MSIRVIARTKKTVTISRRDFDALVEELEDAQDVVAYDRAMAQIAAEGSDSLPVEMVERLLAGENRVRVWREHRKMTARALAAKAGVNAGYLSMIENGRKPGSVAAMMKLAAALDLQIDDLVRQGEIDDSPPLDEDFFIVKAMEKARKKIGRPRGAVPKDHRGAGRKKA